MPGLNRSATAEANQVDDTELQAEIERFGRLYVASSRVSHAVVRSRSRQELLDEVARVLVDAGKFAMALLSWLDPETRELVPVARFGDVHGYVDRIRVFADESPEGHGPAGTAFRTGAPYVCNDFLNDPRTERWREAARESGWRASAAFPILIGGSPRGLLSVYAYERDAFGPDRVELLRQVVFDVAFGLEHLEDVERRCQTEAALAASERRLQLVMAAVALGVFDLDLQTGRLVWDPHTERMFGFEPGTFDGTRAAFTGRVHPDDLPGLERSAELARDSRTTFSHEFRIVWPDGSEHWLLGQGGYLYAENGRPHRMYGAVADITGQKRVGMALRESEERLRQAVRVSNIGIFEHDHVAGAIYWSPEQRAIHGWGPDEPVTLAAFVGCIHPEDREKAAAAVMRAHDPAGDGLFDVEHRVVRPDGSVRWASVRSQTFFEGEGAARRPVRTVGATRDITGQRQAEAEKAKLEEQLFQAQKMESIGRLAGGVAHDFNNLLTVINGYAQLALAETKLSDSLRTSLEEIRKAGERAVSLTRRLLAFSRKEMLQPRALDLNRVVRGLQPMLERLMGEDVEVRVALHAAATVHADPQHLEQVIMNLAVNARDAMPGGGRLMIETADVALDSGYARLHPEAKPGRCVMLAVSDSGVGMTPATQKRIFEPFFTTKPAGHGTGLGLSMVQGIVAQSGGHINVYSEPGRGTTFKIYLPAVKDPALDLPVPAAGEALEGCETVLVVEDMAEVREYAAAALRAHGYQVITAASAAEALQVCEKEPGRVHLLLSDVVMPNMGGPELAGRVEELCPGIKTLLMSGYTNNAISINGALDKSVEFIEKPFSPRELARRVRVLLGPAADSE